MIDTAQLAVDGHRYIPHTHNCRVKCGSLIALLIIQLSRRELVALRAVSYEHSSSWVLESLFFSLSGDFP